MRRFRTFLNLTRSATASVFELPANRSFCSFELGDTINTSLGREPSSRRSLQVPLPCRLAYINIEDRGEPPRTITLICMRWEIPAPFHYPTSTGGIKSPDYFKVRLQRLPCLYGQMFHRTPSISSSAFFNRVIGDPSSFPHCPERSTMGE